jgi:hypothetical protein
VCRSCGSRALVRNGHRFTVDGPVQTYKCKNCGRRSCDTKHQNVGLEDLAARYVIVYNSFRSMAEAFGLKKSRIYYMTRKDAAKAPSGIELSNRMKHLGLWGSVFSIDTTSLKIKGKEYNYIHCVDVISGDPLDYVISEHKDAPTVIGRLREIRYGLNYVPRLAVLDLAPELILGVKTVFPTIPIQGCLVHLERDLNKKLPTKRVQRLARAEMKGMTTLLQFLGSGLPQRDEGKEQKLQVWEEAKRKILAVAYARDERARRRLLWELRIFYSTSDYTVQRVIDGFLNNLCYYHTAEELLRLGLSEQEIRKLHSTNLCENHIGQVVHLWVIHRGFKSLEAAKSFLNYYWFTKRTQRLFSTRLDAFF